MTSVAAAWQNAGARTRLRCTTVLGTVSLLLVFPVLTGAQRTPTWLAPLDLYRVATTSGIVNAARIAVDDKGNAVAVWRLWNGSTWIMQASERRASGTWRAPAGISRPGVMQDPQVAVNGSGVAIAVWTRRNGLEGVIQAARRTAAGAWPQEQSLSASAGESSSPSVAVDARGNAIAVWRRQVGSMWAVEAATCQANGTWQAPRTVAVGDGEVREELRVAFDGKGNAIAAWARRLRSGDTIVEASSRPARGSWQAPELLSAPTGTASSPQIALDRRGTAFAVWMRVLSGGFTVIQSAVRPVGGAWRRPEDVSSSASQALSPDLAVSARGDALVAWKALSQGIGSVQAAVRTAGSSRWQAPESLSSANGNAQDVQVTMDPRGSAVAVWRRTPNVAEAARRPVGGTWQAPEDVSGKGADAPEVAVDAQGNAFGLWIVRVPGESAVQAVGYDAAGPQLRALRIPAKGKRGARLSFSVSPLDVWSGVGTTNWRFGDGGKANGAKASHVYRRPGRFTVTVTSEDGLGHTTTVTRVVRVR
jgi:hypothetical protein